MFCKVLRTMSAVRNASGKHTLLGKKLMQFLYSVFVNQQDVLVKYYAPASSKSQKAIFSLKVKVKVIDLGVIWKDIINLVE